MYIPLRRAWQEGCISPLHFSQHQQHQSYNTVYNTHSHFHTMIVSIQRAANKRPTRHSTQYTRTHELLSAI